ncbi:alkaline phosphatase PhoX [Halalkalicoccus jeotgali]|uniref:alkaline phosphatase PhoX n=1 Tax=Halalkalicoccus jeotgali TaxID=413810 RepID=UPI000B0339BF|nr:alkaline phosphatase PhoX [Halalkalicoccus jeotgali]
MVLTELTRRRALEVLALAAVGTTGVGADGSKGEREGHDHDEEGPTLNRFATSIIGSEVTGMFITREGRFFFNVQHPDADQDGEDEPGIVGGVRGLNINDLPRDFPSVQIPAGDDDDYGDGDGTPESYDRMVQTAMGSYQPILEGGTDIGDGERLGVPATPGGEHLTNGTMPDFNGYVPVENDSKGVHEGYLFTNWETRPGMMSRIHVVSKGTGPWQVLDAENVDFRDVEGTWVNCFGTVSPWDTPLTSEENYSIPDTDRWNDPEYDGIEDVERLAKYLGYETNDEGIYDEEYPNPYRYGYIVEITDPVEDPTPVKQFALGRSTHENAVVMPDEKTAYTTSDGTARGFYKFIADEAGDLSSGTLYAAKAIQQGPVGGDPADVGFELEWIELGHASNEEIEGWIAEYDDVTQADYTEGETSYITDEEVERWAAGNGEDDRVAFLETNRAAGALGATDEFRKMEGVNIRRDADIGDYAYVAMSETNQTFLPNEAAAEEYDDAEDHIQVNGDEWGAVYQMRLYGEGERCGKQTAAHDYDLLRMEPVVTGGPNANICGGCPYDARPDSKSTVCEDCSFNPAKESEEGVVGRGMEKIETVFTKQGFDPSTTIANPDNIVVMDDGRVVIGEDTSLEGHENNMVWIYDPDE